MLLTIPVQNNDSTGEISRRSAPYNALLRDVAGQKAVALADLSQAMKERYAADPTGQFTFDGERFNHEGSMLMAGTITRSIGMADRITSKLRKIWQDRQFYAGGITGK